MGNIAELIVRNPSPENIQQAESWAKKGLDVVKATRNDTHVKYEICEAAYAVMLYNLAMTREVCTSIYHQNLGVDTVLALWRYRKGSRYAHRKPRSLRNYWI